MKTQETNTLGISRNWHALYVSSRSEKKVAELLVEKGVEAYVPLVKSMRQWSDRKKMVRMPLLNGYVFVHVTSQEREKPLQVRGVVSYVRSEGKVAIIRQDEISRLQQLVDLGYQLEARPMGHSFTKGTRVKFSAGPLHGIEGMVITIGDTKQLEVLLESIGHAITVRVPMEILQPA
jgi:transcription antitermination factor NusG